jgi:L-iditol 2-dehydrogenase
MNMYSIAARSALPSASMRVHVLTKPGEIVLRDVPRPLADRDGVLVRVRAALTCGTDVKAFIRGHPKFPMPTAFGHEFAGEIAEAGVYVTDFQPGDEIMVTPTAPCGGCYYCVREQQNLCPQAMETMVLGAYGEYVKVPGHVVRTNMYHKPPRLSFVEAALLEPLACVVHGLSQVKLREDDTVLLIGSGAISLLHLLALRARRTQRTIVVGRGEQRTAQAKALGAGEVIAGGAEKAVEKVLDLTGGMGADVVIECTGQVRVWELAPSLVRRGGQVVLFGGCPTGTIVRFDTARLHYDEVTITSPFHFTPRDVRAAYELLATGSFGGAALIKDHHPLEELPQALQRHRSGEGAKFAIVP